MWYNESMKKLLSFIGASSLIAITTVITYASIPAPNGTINGCYKTNNPGQGALIVIDSNSACPNGTTSLNWNQTGPQGPAGPTGATGATGPQGPQGPAGMANSQSWTAPDSDPIAVVNGSWQQVAPDSGSFSITLSEPQTVQLTGEWNSLGGVYNWAGRFIVDGVDVHEYGMTYGAPIIWSLPLSAGTHTITLEAFWGSGGCTGCTQTVGSRVVSIIDLG